MRDTTKAIERIRIEICKLWEAIADINKHQSQVEHHAEPKPEPEQPKSAYQVGDFVVCTYYRSPLPPKNSYERVIEVNANGIVTKSNDGYVTEYDINGNHGDIHGWHIDRVISPYEHIVTIGCLSGTIKDLSYEEDGRFWFIGRKTERWLVGIHCILYLEMLDAQTLEIVESLLKAQEEKK